MSEARATTERVLAELEQLGAWNTPLDIDIEAIPTLAELAADAPGGAAADRVHHLIAEATQRLPSRSRQALELVLGDTDERWSRNLTNRKRLAADRLAIPYNTFRVTNAKTGRSPYQSLLAELATELVTASHPAAGDAAPVGEGEHDQPSPDTAGPNPRADADDNPFASGSRPPEERPGGRRTAGLALAGLMAGLVLGGVLLLNRSGDKSGTDTDRAAITTRAPEGSGVATVLGTFETPATDGAGIDDPALDDSATNTGTAEATEPTAPAAAPATDTDAAAISPPTITPPTITPPMCAIDVGAGATDSIAAEMQVDYADAGGLETLGCPTHEVERRGGVQWQELQRHGLTTGGFIGTDNDAPLLANRGQWRSYIRVGGGDGSESPARAGALTGEVVETDDGWSLGVDSGVALLGEAEDSSFYWLPEIVVEAWAESGRSSGIAGRPTSSPYVADGGLRQDFENGYFTLAGSGDLAFTEVADPAAELAGTGDLRGRIISAGDGTGWVVDDQLRRWWLPDVAHWNCAGGEANHVARGLSGSAVHTLEFGGVAHCPTHRSGFSPVGGSNDLTSYCRAHHDAPATAEANADGWFCSTPQGDEPIDPVESCAWQYGPDVFPSLRSATDWVCGNP